MDVGRDHRRGRVGAHAAGVGAAVAVVHRLVVLRRDERQHPLECVGLAQSMQTAIEIARSLGMTRYLRARTPGVAES